jgi:hypothetical protein
MLKPFLAASVLFIVLSGMTQSSVRLELKTLPQYHAAGSDIYMAGSFNGWNPQDAQYRFQKTEKGDYYIDLKLDEGIDTASECHGSVRH